MKFTKDRAELLWRHKILFQHNSPAPNEKKYGWLELEEDIKIHKPVVIESNSGLFGGKYSKPSIGGRPMSGLCTIGSFSYSYSPMPTPVSVGRYCSISNGLVFLDSHHPLDLYTTSIITFRPTNHLVQEYASQENIKKLKWNVQGGKSFPVIENDVWIGRDVTLAMGITIGSGSVIAAGSVVTKDVPPYTIIGGNPARPIRNRFPDEIAKKLLSLEWWKYNPKVLSSLGNNPIDIFCETLERLISDSAIELFNPSAFQITDNTFLQIN